MLLSLFVLFDDVIFSGWDKTVVDTHDGRLILAIWEHWFLFFSGEAAWNSPGFFYPATHTIGYTDTLFLNGCIYSVFRLAGFEPVTSMTWVVGLLAVAGFTGFRKLLGRLGVSPWFSLYFSILFLIGAPIQTAIANSHAQLLNIWVLPWVVILFLESLSAFSAGNRIRSAWCVAASVALFSLVAISTFYIAWFFLFVLFLGLFLFCLVNLRAYRKGLLWIKERISLWLVAGMTGIPFFAMFLVIYLPPRLVSGGRTFELALPSLPGVLQLGSLSGYNWIWHSVVGLGEFLPGDSYPSELFYGFPWLFLLTFIFVLSGLLLRWLSHPGRDSQLLLLPGLVVLLGWMMMVRVGDSTLWQWVMAVLPGAEGVRAVFRMNMIYYALALVFLARVATKILPRSTHRQRTALATGLVILGGLLLIENVQTGFPSRLTLSEERQQRANLEPPPFAMEAFWAYQSQASGHMYAIQKRAMRASQMLRIPTINGTSGLDPVGWELLYTAAYEQEFAPVARWMFRKKIEGKIGILEIDSGRWSEDPFDPVARFSEEVGDLAGRNLAVDSDLEVIFIDGWSIPEGSFRWSEGKEARILIPNLSATQESILRLVGSGYVPGDHELTGEIWLANRRVSTFALNGLAPELDISIPLRPADVRPEGMLDIRLAFANPVSPARVGESADTRELGLALTVLEVDYPLVK